MPKKLTEGDAILIADREATAADTKSGLFYPHYRGLTGTVGKLYADGTATVQVDEASLQADVRERHLSGSQAMRQKWLDGLSDEARNRLSAAEKKFALRYTLLVSADDLSILEAGAADGKPSGQRAPDPKGEEEPARKSLADLDAEEVRHLEEVTKKARD